MKATKRLRVPRPSNRSSLSFAFCETEVSPVGAFPKISLYFARWLLPRSVWLSLSCLCMNMIREARNRCKQNFQELRTGYPHEGVFNEHFESGY